MKYHQLKTLKLEIKKITSLTNGTFVWTTVDGFFIVRFCNYLKSLEGAPEKVGGVFNCSNCKGNFTEEDVKKVSNVNRNIIC